jgi:hypothetical protein
MAVSESSGLQVNLSERLGQLIDIGGSMRLSALHDDLTRIAVNNKAANSRVPKEEVLRVRSLLIKSILESFQPGPVAGHLKLPILKPGVALTQLATFEPYRRFYLSHQREFEYKIQRLQFRVRDLLADISNELAQLCLMDDVIRDILVPHTRKYIATIPKLLGKRFETHLQSYLSQAPEAQAAIQSEQLNEALLSEWTASNGWLNNFCQEMQGLLLAELEFRFLPVLGLIEAVDEQVDKQ